MNRYFFLLLLTCMTTFAATFPDTSTDQQVIINSNNVSAGSTSLRWSFTNNRLTVGPTGLGSRVDVEGATPAWRLYAGGNPAASYSRLEGFWDSAAQIYYLHENVSGSNAIPFVVGINGGATLTFNTDSTATHSGGLGLSGATNRLSIANDTLLLDGVPVVGGAGVTNIFDTTIITNNFFVSGKGNTLVVTQALTIQAIKTNLVATTSTGLLTNANYGTGIAWDPATLTISSTATGGGASVWMPNTALGYTSSTNLTIDGSGGTNFTVFLTNTAFFATPANIPASKATNTMFTVYFQQDSTGGRLVTWTNASFFFPGNSPFQPLTNANAMSSVTFSMSPFTNGIFIGDYGVYY